MMLTRELMSWISFSSSSRSPPQPSGETKSTLLRITTSYTNNTLISLWSAHITLIKFLFDKLLYSNINIKPKLKTKRYFVSKISQDSINWQHLYRKCYLKKCFRKWRWSSMLIELKTKVFGINNLFKQQIIQRNSLGSKKLLISLWLTNLMTFFNHMTVVSNFVFILSFFHRLVRILQ